MRMQSYPIPIPLSSPFGLRSFCFEEKVDPPADPEKAKEGEGGDDGKKKSEKKEPKKLELTEDELLARIEREVAKVKKQYEKEREEQKRKADEEKAKETGQFKELYESEAAKTREKDEAIAALKREHRSTIVDLRLRDYLTANHPEYSPVAKYIKPLIEFDAEMADDELDLRIKQAAEQYVADNPRSADKSTIHAPGHSSRVPASVASAASAKEKLEKLTVRRKPGTGTQW